MKNHTRVAVAFIVASITSGSGKSSVYDYSLSKHHFFSGNASNDQVSVYDHTQGCHISGSLPSVYHYGNSKHITLNLDGDRFTGYDYDTFCHFSGNVNGSSITLYDHGESKHFQFSM